MGIFNDMLAVFWWWPWGCSAEMCPFHESAWNLQLKASHCCPLWRFHKKMLVKQIEVNRAAALGPAAAGAPGPMGSGLTCPLVRRAGQWLSALLRATYPRLGKQRPRTNFEATIKVQAAASIFPRRDCSTTNPPRQFELSPFAVFTTFSSSRHHTSRALDILDMAPGTWPVGRLLRTASVEAVLYPSHANSLVGVSTMESMLILTPPRPQPRPSHPRSLPRWRKRIVESASS